MAVSDDTLVLAAATLAAAMVRADIAADHLRLDGEGSHRWVMDRFETTLEELQEQFPGETDEPAAGKPGSIEMFGPTA